MKDKWLDWGSGISLSSICVYISRNNKTIHTRVGRARAPYIRTRLPCGETALAIARKPKSAPPRYRQKVGLIDTRLSQLAGIHFYSYLVASKPNIHSFILHLDFQFPPTFPQLKYVHYREQGV